MSRFKKRITIVAFCIVGILLDVCIYIVLGLLLMNYDDNYDASKGEYFSWASMTTFARFVYGTLQFWHVVNIAALIYVAHKVYKQFKLRTPPVSQNVS